MNQRATTCMVLCGIAAALLMPSSAHARLAQDRASATEKGSLLVYSNVEIRWSSAAGNAVLQDTFIEMSNDFPQDVRVLMYFVNGDAPIPADPASGERAHPGWNWVDNEFTLTANQPTWWSALSGTQNVVVPPATAPALSPFTVLDPGTPPGRPSPDGSNFRLLRGFIYAWAVNAEGAQIRWNHLSGQATHLNYGVGAAGQYNAVSFAALAGANGDAVGTPGMIQFDGIEYVTGPGSLLFNFRATSFSSGLSGPGATVAIDTDLTLHPLSLDVRQETNGPVTTKAHFDVWNENEVKFSGAYRCITCWDQTLLSNYGIPNHFILPHLQTQMGKARIEGLKSQLCDLNFDPANDDDFPYPPGPGDPVDPRDIVSQDTSLLGVAAEQISIVGNPITLAPVTKAGETMRNLSHMQLTAIGNLNPIILFGTVFLPGEATDGAGSDGREAGADELEINSDELQSTDLSGNRETRR